MSSKDFEIEQLRAELDRTKEEHKRELTMAREEWETERKELQSAVKVKARIEEVVHAEYTQEYFPRAIILMLTSFNKDRKLAHVYIKWMSLLNFVFVWAIGLLLNTYIMELGGQALGPVFTNVLAKGVMLLWLWNFTVGPLGYIFGLAPRKKVVKET